MHWYLLHAIESGTVPRLTGKGRARFKGHKLKVFHFIQMNNLKQGNKINDSDIHVLGTCRCEFTHFAIQKDKLDFPLI